MELTRQTALFFDASVLVAGAHSPDGGSALLLEACRLGGFRPQTSMLIVAESHQALRSHFPRQRLSRRLELLEAVLWELLPVPSQKRRHHFEDFVHPKDAYVIATAIDGRSDFLITLDRRHISACRDDLAQVGYPLQIATPREFIQGFYPKQIDYPRLPPSR